MKTFDELRKEIARMTISEMVRKLQTPGHGSVYQDEKLLFEFVEEKVAAKTENLRKIIMEREAEIADLKRKITRLSK